MQESIATPEQLVQARENRGLSVGDVSRELRLAPRQLAALESGDWSTLPGLAFVRGVLRAYGRLLEADVEPLVVEVPMRVGAAELHAVATLDQPLPRRSTLGFGGGGRGKGSVWIGLAIVGLIVLALFFGGGARISSIESWLRGEVASVGERMPAGEAVSEPTAERPSGLQSPDAGTMAGTVTVPVPLQLPSAEPLRGPLPSGAPRTDAAAGPKSRQQ